jgi:hypothetical protein
MAISGFPSSEQEIVSGIILTVIGGYMKQSSAKVREVKTALIVALCLAIVSFGTAFVAAGYIAK